MNKRRMNSLSSRVLFRGNRVIKRAKSSYSNALKYKMSRDEAKRIWKLVISHKEQKIVNRTLLQTIKAYCKDTFNSSSYWPWLALYTELRGEFIEGWTPDDYYRFELLPKYNPEKYSRLSEAKTLDYKLFEKSVVEPLYVRLNGQFFNKKGVFKTPAEVEQEIRMLDKDIIIKPDGGKSGQGIIFCSPDNYRTRGLPENINLLFQYVVDQHAELSRLHPHSVNTIRVLTAIDERGLADVKFAFIRFGISGCRVDNMNNGGGWVFINSDGEVGSIAYNKLSIPIGSVHPDTGVKLSDVQIPNFASVLSLCVESHQEFPYNGIIGWDVYLDRSGEPKFLEWNANNPGFWNIEALYGPIFGEEFGHDYDTINYAENLPYLFSVS